MTKHPNFYENLAEAQMRLVNTVVLYDGEPYMVLTIAAHAPDGIFRVYLDPIDWDGKEKKPQTGLHNISQGDSNLGPYMDQWMKDTKGHRVIRKRMDSKHFNKFRPYPLGMCNIRMTRNGEETGRCYYLARQPQRQREQGINTLMVDEHRVTLGKRDGPQRVGMDAVPLYSRAFHACVKGIYPSPKDCLVNLLDPDIENDAVGFSRHFALLRGPVDTLFLGYKTDVIGSFPRDDFSLLRLERKFVHTKEVIEELNLINTIDVVK